MKIWKKLCVSGLFLSTAFLAGCSNGMPELIQLDKIVSFGDSLTYGYNLPRNQTYPAYLKEITGYNVVNEGLNGERAAAAKERLKEVLEYHNPAAIIISLGGNDMLVGESDNLEQDLTDLITIAKNHDTIAILMAQPQPTVGRLRDAEVFEVVAKKEGVLLIENTFTKYLNNSDYKLDLIHLNAQGYERVANDVAKKLKSEGLIDY